MLPAAGLSSNLRRRCCCWAYTDTRVAYCPARWRDVGTASHCRIYSSNIVPGRFGQSGRLPRDRESRPFPCALPESGQLRSLPKSRNRIERPRRASQAFQGSDRSALVGTNQTSRIGVPLSPRTHWPVWRPRRWGDSIRPTSMSKRGWFWDSADENSGNWLDFRGFPGHGTASPRRGGPTSWETGVSRRSRS